MQYPPTDGYSPATGNTSQGHNIPDPFQLPDGGGYSSFTLEFYYFLATPLAANQGAFTNIAPGAAYNTNGLNLYFRSEAGASYAFTVNGTFARAGTVNTDVWTHLAFTFDAATGAGRIVENGVDIGGDTFPTPLPQVAYLHADFNDGDPTFTGKLANVRFWDYPLSAAELDDARTTVYEAGTTGLLAAYAFTPDGTLETPFVGTTPAVKLGTIHTERYELATFFQARRQPAGSGTIAGTVTVDGSPAARSVVVLDRETRQRVAETTSESDGTYSVGGLIVGREYLVLGIDDANEYNAVAADRILPADA